MFKRAHHQRIEKVLRALNSDLFLDAECYFGGGTAIALSIGEYRQSIDVDFLCASIDGYRLLRNTIGYTDLGPLIGDSIKQLREVRADRYGIRTVLEVDGTPIKFEIVSEGRIQISGAMSGMFGVPTLCRADMYAEKLLANADRWADRSTLNRDIIDLAMMINQWGPIPKDAWDKALGAYGNHMVDSFSRAVERVSDQKYLTQCLEQMQADDVSPGIIMDALSQQLATKPTLALESQSSTQARPRVR